MECGPAYLDFDADDGRDAAVGGVGAGGGRGVREEREVGHEEREFAVDIDLGVLPAELRPALLHAGAQRPEKRRRHHDRHLASPPKAPSSTTPRVSCRAMCVVSCHVWWYPGVDVGGADQGSHDVVHERVLLELVVLDVDWRA